MYILPPRKTAFNVLCTSKLRIHFLGQKAHHQYLLNSVNHRFVAKFVPPFRIEKRLFENKFVNKKNSNPWSSTWYIIFFVLFPSMPTLIDKKVILPYYLWTWLNLTQHFPVDWYNFFCRSYFQLDISIE